MREEEEDSKGVKIVSEATLDLFRTAGNCSWCGRYCQKREPHHLWPRGHGGGFRLDVRINLIALGSGSLFYCSCHGMVHSGEIARHDLLVLVANREDTRQQDIEAVIPWLQRLPKDATHGQIEAGLAELTGPELALARRVLIEAKKLEEVA